MYLPPFVILSVFSLTRYIRNSKLYAFPDIENVDEVTVVVYTERNFITCYTALCYEVQVPGRRRLKLLIRGRGQPSSQTQPSSKPDGPRLLLAWLWLGPAHISNSRPGARLVPSSHSHRDASPRVAGGARAWAGGDPTTLLKPMWMGSGHQASMPEPGGSRSHAWLL